MDCCSTDAPREGFPLHGTHRIQFIATGNRAVFSAGDDLANHKYLADRFQVADDEVEEHPRYNIAPTQPVLIVRKEQGKKIRHFTTMRWRLISPWAKDVSIGNRTLNARSETVTTTPAFRDSESMLASNCWPMQFANHSKGKWQPSTCDSRHEDVSAASLKCVTR
jgi:hypothetical protein